MRINPMVKKDIKVQARSMRICWEIFAYEAIMAVVFFFAMFLFSQQMTYSSANIYSSIVWLYPALAVTQIFILGVVVPVRTASAISGEKERQTFDIMMTTSMTGFSIIMGKVLTAMIQSMFYVVAGLPIVALAFVIGGLSWGNLFWFLAVSLLVSFVSASIGILCSSICKKNDQCHNFIVWYLCSAVYRKFSSLSGHLGCPHVRWCTGKILLGASGQSGHVSA